MDEAVANYAGRLINETDVLDKFLAENKQNKTLLQKMVDGIRKLIRKVTGAEKRQLQTVEGKLLAAMNAATDVPVMPGVRSGFYDTTQYSLKVTDEPTLSFLNGQDTITTYKTMQVIDGKLYPPMAARVGGQYEDASELGTWEMASEHPELATKDGKFKLDKGKGQGSIQAAYNPYMHSSNLVINDQFSGAYARPNLVTVECEVPASEATSNYRAENAKDTTGWHSWHTGTVAGAVRAQKGIERQVFLSRWIKPVRIIPNSEVAQMYAELLSGTDIAVPDNVVPPALLDELRLAGVPISESGRVKNDSAARFSLKAYDGVDLAENSRVYDYDFLVSLPDMEVVELPELSDLRNADNRIDTGKVLSAGMKNARAVGTERDGKTYVTNRYTGHELRIDNSTIRHGLNGSANRLFTNARISAVIGDIVENAVPINALNNKASGVSGTYAMATYASDASGRGFVAIVTVEQRTGNVAGISTYDVVHAVSGRQNNRGERVDTKSQGVYPSTNASKISIPSFLDVVKNTHQSILSNDVLANIGLKRNPNGFYTNQVKFSLKESVEETKDLIAVHNVSEQGLLGALELGGLPSPSIAITKDDMGHEKYGPISLVFGKETIDPQFFRANKVYGSDAWTPTAPKVEYPVNSKKLFAVERDLHRLAGSTDVAGGIFGNSSVLRSMGLDDTSTKSAAELAEAISQTDAGRAAYLRTGYNKAKTEDPAFVADMMKLEAMTPNIPRGKVDFDTLTQVEPDPIEWQRYDAAREKFEGQYGDMKVWNFVDLLQELQQAEAAPGRTASELYRDTAGEIEARDVENRANLTAAERKAKAPNTGNQDTVFADDGTNDSTKTAIKGNTEDGTQKNFPFMLSFLT